MRNSTEPSCKVALILSLSKDKGGHAALNA
jgi:hypothetical protein